MNNTMMTFRSAVSAVITATPHQQSSATLMLRGRCMLLGPLTYLACCMSSAMRLSVLEEGQSHRMAEP